MVICLERGEDLRMAQLLPLPLIVSCFNEIKTGFTFLVPAHPGSHGQRAVKRVCVCVFMLLVTISASYYCCRQLVLHDRHGGFAGRAAGTDDLLSWRTAQCSVG